MKPVLIDLNNIKKVSCGIFHTGLLTKSGKILSTGANSFGQLGNGTKMSTCIPTRVKGLESACIETIAFGGHSSCISDAGEIFIWGSGVWGEYLLPQKMAH